MQHINQAAGYILENSPEQVKSGIASLKRKVREKAVGSLLEGLKLGDEYSELIFHAIPLELLDDGDYIGALWYVETTINQGNLLSSELVQKVLGEASEKLISLQSQEQDDHAAALQKVLISTYKTVSKQGKYTENPEFHVMKGGFFESIGENLQAIEEYNMAITQGDLEGHLRAALVYEEQGNLDMSKSVLEMGWTLFDDPRMLSRLVHVLCSMNEREEAFSRYQELKKALNEEISPFIVYLGRIEDDQSLELFEEILAQYQLELSFVPSEGLARLSRSAFEYIGSEFWKENQIIENINAKQQDPEYSLTDWELEEYFRAFERRLWLMQADILALKNHRYLSVYLSDMRNTVLHGSDSTKETVRNLFHHHYSPEATYQVDWEDEVDEKGKIDPVRIIKQGTAKNSLYEDILNHVAKIGEVFYQGTLYDIYRDKLNPLMLDLVNADHDIEDDVRDEVYSSFAPLKSETDFIDSMRPSIRDNYYGFVEAFTNKYGMFYRRTIQCLARNPHITEKKYPSMLLEYPDIALFFFIEKIVAGQFPTGDDDEIDRLVNKYKLMEANISDVILFVSVMYDISPSYCFDCVLSAPYLFEIPEIVYLVLECVRRFDTDEVPEAMKELDEVVHDEFDADNFQDFIESMRSDFIAHEDDILPGEMAYMFLCNADMKILSGEKNGEESMLNFLTASEIEGVEGLLQAGDSAQNDGNYDAALDYFDRALVETDTIEILSKCLSCAIEGGNISRAEQYMSHAFSQEYGLHSHQLSILLQRKRIKEALQYVIFMIREEIEVLDTPNGTLHTLLQSVVNILKLQDAHDIELDKLKILASYIYARLSVNSSEILIEDLLEHWGYIESFCYFGYEEEEMYASLEDIFSHIIGHYDVIPVLDDSGRATGEKEIHAASKDEILAYHLHLHASGIYKRIQKKLELANDESEEGSEKLGNLLDTSIEFSSTVIAILRRMCPRSKYIVLWQKNIITGEEAMLVQNKGHDFYNITKSVYH